MNNLAEREKLFNELLIYFDGISIFFWLIPLPFVVFSWRKLEPAMKIFGTYLGVLVSLHIIEHIHIQLVLKYDVYWEFMKKFEIKDTNFFNITYRFACLFFIGSFYDRVTNNSKKFPISIKVFSLLLCIFSIFIYLFIDGFRNYGTFNAILIRVFQIGLSLFYIRRITQIRLSKSVFRNPIFLISLGILLPSTVTLIMSFIGDGLHDSNFVLYVEAVMFRNVVGFAGDILFAFSFYMYTRRTVHNTGSYSF